MKAGKFFFVLFTFLLPLAGFSQNGIIRGKITEDGTSEPMTGAVVKLFQEGVLKNGAAADLDGLYEVANIVPGTYDLQITYISYDTVRMNNLRVEPGKVLFFESVLKVYVSDDDTTNVVNITDRIDQTTNTYVNNIKLQTVSLVDGIGASQFRKTGDPDAAQAAQRITSVTVEGGKYVYVRGLGDRYSKTTLNGSEIPGLDPDRNAVQMDLFPTNLIDNILVYKTFTPDLPGSFSGGLVEITTKDFPERFTLQYSSSFGYNTNASLKNDFLTYDTGKLDWLGIDDGTRALPAQLVSDNSVPEVNFTDANEAHSLEAATKAFSTGMYPYAGNSFLDHSHSFSVGNQKKLFGKPFGYIFSLTYSNSYARFADGVSGRYKLASEVSQAEELQAQVLLNDESATRDILTGSLANFSWKPSDQHKISLNLMHDHGGTDNARYMHGTLPEDDPNLNFETRVLTYRQRMLDAAQLKGNHLFSKEKLNLRVSWTSAATRSSQIEPDVRFFSSDYTISNGDTAYDIQTALYAPPSRYFRNMRELNLDNKIDFELPFRQWSGLSGKIKFGGAHLMKSRTFGERRFQYEAGSSTAAYNGDPDVYFGDENLGLAGESPMRYALYIDDVTELRNNYSGEQNVAAGYAMAELPLCAKLRFITGARLETTRIRLESEDPSLPIGYLKNADLLPSVNLIWSPKKDKMNFRAVYARTLARPTFRELAPFASFEFVKDYTLIGNANLQRTLIDNFDLRWEFFPTGAEIVSVSAFYKNFQNPIERVINPTAAAATTELNYRNVPHATAYGLELEVKKSFYSFFPETPFLRNFRTGFNVTLIRSRLDINPQELAQIRVLNPEAESFRPMFGQSPWTLNWELSYMQEEKGFMASFNFNMFGPRISAVSAGGTPNVYERPRPIADFTISQNISERWSLRLRARNLFDPLFRQSHEFKGEMYDFQSYRLGRTFSVGISYSIR